MYNSSVIWIENFKEPIMVFNSPFTWMEKEFMNQLEIHFPKTYQLISNPTRDNLKTLFSFDAKKEIQMDCQYGCIHVVKNEKNNHFRLIFVFNPTEDKPLLSKLQDEWLCHQNGI